MAGKYALYLPYHIIIALENEGFSNAEIGTFIRGIIKYHLEGIPPRFKDRALNLLFSDNKPEFDHNIEKYKAIVEVRRESGKKGGAPKGNANAAGNRGGGAPSGNKNAAKTENKHKQMFEFNSKNQTQAKQADIELDSDIDTRNSDGNQKKPPPPLLLNVKSKITDHGFFLDNSDIESLIQATNADWFEGHDFIDFIAETFREGGYGNKPKREQHNLFRKLLFDAQNLREEYPEWRKKKIVEAAAEEEHRQRETDAQERRKRIDQARANKPKACGHCGTALYPENEHGTCPSCGFGFFFDETSEAYTFQEPQESFAAIFNRHMKSRGKGQSEVMEAVS